MHLQNEEEREDIYYTSSSKKAKTLDRKIIAKRPKNVYLLIYAIKLFALRTINDIKKSSLLKKKLGFKNIENPKAEAEFN